MTFSHSLSFAQENNHPKVVFSTRGTFWTKSELFLSKTPTKEANPATARQARHPAKKFSSYFLICARRFFSSKRKRKLFFEVLLLTSRTAGLSSFCIRSGVAEFPPHLPSASPSLPTAFFSVGLLFKFLHLFQILPRVLTHISTLINRKNIQQQFFGNLPRQTA